MNGVDFYERRRWFERYRAEVLAGEIKESAHLLKHTCPCCGYPTLEQRGAYEICTICWWEDDGTDEADLGRVSGPNHITLAEGRRNFELCFHSEGRGVEVNPGVNDVKATRNRRRAAEGFDGMLSAATTEETDALVGVANEALDENTKDMLNAFGYGDEGEGRE